MARPFPFLSLLPELWRTVSAPPSTVGYPFAPLDLPSTFRGRVVIDAEKCRGCGLCVRDCPAFALELEREDRDRFHITYYPDRCAYCGQCEVSCHSDAISLQNDFVHGVPERESLKTLLVDRGNGHHDEEL